MPWLYLEKIYIAVINHFQISSDIYTLVYASAINEKSGRRISTMPAKTALWFCFRGHFSGHCRLNCWEYQGSCAVQWFCSHSEEKFRSPLRFSLPLDILHNGGRSYTRCMGQVQEIVIFQYIIHCTMEEKIWISRRLTIRYTSIPAHIHSNIASAK